MTDSDNLDVMMNATEVKRIKREAVEAKLKEIRQKIEAEIVHKTWYCEDCDETLTATFNHNADHSIRTASEFLNRKAVLAILGEEKP